MRGGEQGRGLDGGGSYIETYLRLGRCLGCLCDLCRLHDYVDKGNRTILTRDQAGGWVGLLE